MIFNNFLLIFPVAFLVELIRNLFLPFGKLFNLPGAGNGIQSMMMGGSEKKKLIEETEMDSEIIAVKKELADMKEEAAKYNNPDNYAKYGKI